MPAGPEPSHERCSAEITAFLTGLDGLVAAGRRRSHQGHVRPRPCAGMATVVLGRASAAARHLVWALALSSALMLPVLSFALPRWQLPIVTLQSRLADASAAARQLHPPSPEASARQARSRRHASRTREHAPEAQAESHAAANDSANRRGRSDTASLVLRTFSLTTALVAIWMAGVLAVLGRLLVGLVAVQWMSRRTVRVVDAPWLPLAVELAAELGITRRLTFLESPRATMPMASGDLQAVGADAGRCESVAARTAPHRRCCTSLRT